MNNYHSIILVFVLIVSSIFIVDYFVNNTPCIPLTGYTYDIVKDSPIGKYCLCPTDDPLGADKYSMDYTKKEKEKHDIEKHK